MKKNTNYVLVTCLSLFIIVFSMLSLQQQVFSDDTIPALTINSEGNVGLGIGDSKYNLYVIGDAGFGVSGDVDFVSVIDSMDSVVGELNDPYGIAIHQNGDIYVVENASHRVQIFNSTGNFKLEFGMNGSNEGQFKYPTGIAVHPNGDVYVTDGNNHRVQIFDSTGTYISKFGTWGSGAGEFDNPYGITINQNGNIYVTDGNNHRVQIFDSTGTYISKFGTWGSGAGEFDNPYGITINQNGNIYVTDGNNHRVQIFDSTGTYISKFGTWGSGAGEFQTPVGIAIHQNGDIYVVENDNHRVQIFDSTGTYISKFGTWGFGVGQFDRPEGIAVHQNGDIYVTDAFNNRVQIFSTIPVLLVDDNGNVGIGTTTPKWPLTINPKGNWNEWIGLYDENDIPKWHINNGKNNDGINFVETGVADYRLFIKAGGNVGIGTSSPSQKLDVNGDAIANSWQIHSSQKWKKDITPLDNTLDKVTQIQGVTYSWRSDEFPEMSFDDTTQVGFIAEELEMIYPELVYTTENGDKSIDYSKLTPILIEAIKEQQKSIEEQQDTINTQQEKFADQQDMINTQQDILEQLKTVICPNHPELRACQ